MSHLKFVVVFVLSTFLACQSEVDAGGRIVYRARYSGAPAIVQPVPSIPFGYHAAVPQQVAYTAAYVAAPVYTPWTYPYVGWSTYQTVSMQPALIPAYTPCCW